MTIEIKITDISKLSSYEVNKLHTFLLDMVSSKEFNNAFANHAEVKEDERDDVLSANLDGTVSYTPPLKSRKKRKSAPNVDKAPDGYTLTSFETVPLEKVAETINKYATTPPSPLPCVGAGSVLLDDSPWGTPEPASDVTQDELVAYVLEATRNKKLKLDDVMQVISGYDIPTLSLNSIGNHPELIRPVYLKFKGIVDAR